MSTKLAFVERPAQLLHVPREHHIVALSPLAEVELERVERRYTRPEDYLDEMHLEEKALENFGKVETLCTTFDTILARHIPEVESNQMAPARWNYFWLKVMYDAIFIRAYQIQRILSAESPSEVLYFERNKPDFSQEFISESESIYTLVLDRLLPNLNIAAKKLNQVLEPSLAQLNTSNEHQATNSLVRRGASKGVRWLRKSLESPQRRLRRSTRGKILCLGNDYSIPFIIPHLENMGYEVWIWGNDYTVRQTQSGVQQQSIPRYQLLESQKNEVLASVQSNDILAHLFCSDGHDFWPSVEPRIRRLIDHDIPEAINYYQSARLSLKTIKPDLVLTSVAAFVREKAICKAAEDIRIPTAVSRHGGIGCGASPISEYQDIDSVKWILCWGKWEKEWSLQYARKQIQTKIVGSPAMEAQAQQAPSRRSIRERFGYTDEQKIVLYVPSDLAGTLWYGGNRQPTDSSYFRHGKQIVQALTELPGWEIVIQEHPGRLESPLEQWSNLYNSKSKIRVLRNEQFARLINLADAVVFDFPTTTLVQALFGSARIYIALHPVFQCLPGIEEHLASGGVTMCTILDVKNQIFADMKCGLIGINWRYPEEIREPLLMNHANSNGAARRCATVLSQIASSSEQNS